MSASNDDLPTSDARKPLRDGIDSARHHVEDAAASAKVAAKATIERTRDGLDQARERAADAYATGREKAGEVYATAREKASTATGRAGEGIEGNPLAAVLGGIALGVVVGALLPRTQKEAQLFGAVGGKLNEAARDAAGAARDAGKTRLADMGLSRDHAREAVKSVLDAALAAITSAGNAAADTARAKASEGIADAGHATASAASSASAKVDKSL